MEEGRTKRCKRQPEAQAGVGVMAGVREGPYPPTTGGVSCVDHREKQGCLPLRHENGVGSDAGRKVSIGNLGWGGQRRPTAWGKCGWNASMRCRQGR